MREGADTGSTEESSGVLINVFAFLFTVMCFLTAIVGLIGYGVLSDPEFVELTGFARCGAIKEAIDESGIYRSDPDTARKSLEEYRSQIKSACPEEFAQLELELAAAFRNDCATNRWRGTRDIAKDMVECGVNERDHFAITGNAVQMKEGTFFLPTISSVYVENYSYHGVTGYGLRVVLRNSEGNRYFSNRYSNKSDVEADLNSLVEAMGGVTPAPSSLVSNTE